MTDLQTMFLSLQTSLESHRPQAAEPSAPAGGATPVTILTGFLGAGKSTLLAALLTSPPNDMIITAVVNDVGSLDFDPALLTDGASLDIELSNGCGCCVAAGPLQETIERAASSSPDLIVLEASGVTDPFAVAQVVEASPLLVLDRVVAVVSATTLEGHLDDDRLNPTVMRQLAASEAVIVSRADLVDSVALAGIVDRISTLAPGRVASSSTLERPEVTPLVPGGVRGAVDPMSAPTSSLTHSVTTSTWHQTRPLDKAELEAALAARSPEILRCKGRVTTTSGGVLVQAMSDGWTVEAWKGEQEVAEPMVTGLVVTGLVVTGLRAQAVESFAAGLDLEASTRAVVGPTS